MQSVSFLKSFQLLGYYFSAHRATFLFTRTFHCPEYKKLLGYRKGADGEPEIVPEEAEIIRRIYRSYLRGASLGDIVTELTEDGIAPAESVKGWSRQVVRNILVNEKYIGDALLQKTYITDCITKKVRKNNGERPMYYVENHHAAIIPKEIYSSKRKVMQKRPGRKRASIPANTPSRNCSCAENAARRTNDAHG